MNDLLPVHLEALADLCRRHPTARKVVFAPSEQAGRAARAALARAGVAYVALEVTTPAAHAREWLAPEIEAGTRPLPYFAEAFIIDGLLRSLAAAGVDALETAASNPAALRPTIEAIRHAGLDAAALRAVASRGHRGAQRRLALADLVEGYERALEDGRYLDDVRLLRAATVEAQAGGGTDTIYCAFDETRFSSLEENFVRALTASGVHLERIGVGTPGLVPPRRAAAALFWPDLAASVPGPAAGPAAWLGGDDPPPAARQAMARQLRSADPNVWQGVRRAVGSTVEVGDVLRDALGRGLALDDIEVAYVASEPYLSILHAETRERDRPRGTAHEAEGIPATFAAGLPLFNTTLGQAIRGLLDWMEADRDTAVLVRLLQGRLLILDRGRLATNYEAAHDLLTGGSATGAGAIARSLARAAMALERGRGHSESEAETAAALQSIETARSRLDKLSAHVPEETAPPARFAAGLIALLDEFGPVDAVAMRAKDRSDPFTTEELAHLVVTERLRAFAGDAPAGAPMDAWSAAAALRDAMAASFVGASGPRPGRIHVVPLTSAGFAGRRHLYVVGLDAQTSAPGAAEDAVLPDRERDEIDADGRMDRGADAAGAQSWDFARALARVPEEGTVTLCARSHDPASGDTVFPGGLLLRAAELAGLPLGRVVGGQGMLAGLVPRLGLGDIALDETEVDLAFRGFAERRGTLTGRFPVAFRGAIADEQRRGPRWTGFDGWLGGPVPGLDPLAAGAVVSPSRLEDLATCPYRYFVKHILKCEAPPETLDESQLLNAAERGTLLHGVFEQFSRRLRDRGERPSRDHEHELVELTESLVDDALAQRGEPPAPAREALRRAMVDVARLFLYDEVRHAESAEPVAFEHSFGFDVPVALALAEDVVVPLRGYVDRVDRYPDGSYEIADFKTGSSYGFADPGTDASKVIAGGKKLQWALYAYAVRQTEGWNVTRAGYRFVSSREMAERRTYPLPSERTLANVLREVVAPARGGFFPQAPDPAGACRYCEVRRACGDVRRRKEEVAAAAASVAYDLNAEPPLRNWSRRIAG